MKKPTENQIEALVDLVEEYVALINLIDKSPQAKVILGPMMDDLGENDPEMGFAGLDLDRDKARDLLKDLGVTTVQETEGDK